MKLRIILFASLFISLSVMADNTNKEHPSRWQGIKDYTRGILHSDSAGVEYRIKAGIAIGGTAPLPIPPEIQKVKGFDPLLNISLELEIMKSFSEAWGMSFGLRLETKGMKTDAEVKNYNMSMVAEDGGKVSGAWYGSVETQVINSYLTLPVLGVWKPSSRWEIKTGPYISYLTSGRFSGSAYDGYLREGSPIGEKINIESAIYDFSSDIRRIAWGWQLGADWRAFPHLMVGLDLTWGLNSIFKKDFETISFDMYPVYLNLNFGYAF